MPTQTRPKSPKTKNADSDQVFQRLERMIERSDSFTLGFVKCNHPAQQKAMRLEFLARLNDKRVLEVELNQPLISLLDELTARWDKTNPPDVVCVYGLEKSVNELSEASPVLGRLNHDRELIRRSVPVPLLIWLPDFALDLMARGAPDFWAWRSGVYEFATEKTLWQRESGQAISADVLGIFSLTLQEKNAEVAHLKELLRTAQNLPRQGKREKDLIASLMDQLGLIYYSLGQWDEATTMYRQSLSINEDLGDKGNIASNLHQLAMLDNDRGNLAEAERLYWQSLSIKKDIDDKSGIANTFHQLAALEQGRGNLVEAERLYRQSLSMREDLGDKRGIAASLHHLAMLEEERNNVTEAERLYRQSLSINEDLGDKSSIASTLHNLGSLKQKRGDLQEAEHLYRQSLSINEYLGNKRDMARTSGQLGRLYQELGQLQKSLQYYLPAWLSFCEMNSPYSQLARKLIQEIWEQVGDAQFQAWLTEDFGKQAREIRGKLNHEIALSSEE